MRVPKLLSITFITLLASATAPAQEQPPVEEILQWFPLGNYERITYSDEAGLAKADAYDLFKEFLDERTKVVISDMPPALQEGIESVASAQLSKFKISVKPGDSRKPDISSGVRISSTGHIGDKRVTIYRVGDQLWVYRYADLEAAIATALEAGEIVPTGETAQKRPIYAFRTKDRTEEAQHRYCWAALTGELLIAGKPASLRVMIRAGMGLQMNILDEEEYFALIELSPMLGQRWNFDASFNRRMETSALAIRRASENPEIADSFEKYMKDSQPSYYASSWTVDEEIVRRSISGWPDEETAEKHMPTRVWKESDLRWTKSAWDKYVIIKNIAEEVRQEEEKIIRTVVYDRTLLERLKTVREEAEEESARRRAESEKNKE